MEYMTTVFEIRGVMPDMMRALLMVFIELLRKCKL